MCDVCGVCVCAVWCVMWCVCDVCVCVMCVRCVMCVCECVRARASMCMHACVAFFQTSMQVKYMKTFRYPTFNVENLLIKRVFLAYFFIIPTPFYHFPTPFYHFPNPAHFTTLKTNLERLLTEI